MAMKGGWWREKLRRAVRTAYFVVVMVASLLAVSLPLVVSVCDAVLPCLLIPSFTCIGCVGLKEHLRRYAFRSSLVDIPVVSIVRSLIILCAYSISDLQALSHGSYLGTVTFTSLISILLLSFKACVFTINSQFEQESSTYLSRKRLHLKKSWGMPVLFLSSVVFALGHIVVAYHTSCKARRKLIFHRGDLEAVLSCKMVLSTYQKVPRSPIPSAGKSFRGDVETKRKAPALVRDKGQLPVSVLADVDSLFITCQGLIVHYKQSQPASPSRSLSSATSFHFPPHRTPPKSHLNFQKRVPAIHFIPVTPLSIHHYWPALHLPRHLKMFLFCA